MKNSSSFSLKRILLPLERLLKGRLPRKKRKAVPPPAPDHTLFGSLSKERAAVYQRHFEEILGLSPEVTRSSSLESLPAPLRIRIRSVMEDAHRREGINVLYLAVLVDQFLATEESIREEHHGHWAKMVLLQELLPPSVPAPEAFFYAARAWDI